MELSRYSITRSFNEEKTGITEIWKMSAEEKIKFSLENSEREEFEFSCFFCFSKADLNFLYWPLWSLFALSCTNQIHFLQVYFEYFSREKTWSEREKRVCNKIWNLFSEILREKRSTLTSFSLDEKFSKSKRPKILIF